jgi:hypothetical protein
MYTLTLSKAERKAIDWVGDRYGHGNNLYGALCDAEWLPAEVESWDHDGDITFKMNESTAWVINEIGEECEFRWDCFAPALAAKLTDFCMAIV